MGGDLVGPGDVLKVYKAGRFGRQTLDRRGWLRYLRREAVVRALNNSDAIVSDSVGELADEFCELLDREPLPRARRGPLQRAKSFGRRITHGVVYPEFEGASSTTFYERLTEWVRRAASTPDGGYVLRAAGFSAGERSAEVFAGSVANETQALLIESRRPPGQNHIRYKMANEIHRSLPDQHIRKRHEHVRLWIRAFVAGIGSATAAELLFIDDDWLKTIGLGATILAGTAIAEYAGPGHQVGPDMFAARRQAAAWLRVLARRLAEILVLRETVKDLSAYSDEEGLEKILRELSTGAAYVHPVQPGDRILADVESLLETAGRVGDGELRSYLIDVETALKFEPERLPDALRRLDGFVQEGPGSAQRLTRPPELQRPPARSELMGFVDPRL